MYNKISYEIQIHSLKKLFFNLSTLVGFVIKATLNQDEHVSIVIRKKSGG